MEETKTCFCNSNKPHSLCHANVVMDSVLASTYKLYKDIDTEIENQKNTKDLKFQCKKGCSECCNQVFCVSEAEFVLILDSIYCNVGKNRLNRIIDRALKINEYIEFNYSNFYRVLESDATGATNLAEIQYLTSRAVPLGLELPCVFLDKKTKSCSIYDIRPVICRIHGIGMVDRIENKLCSKIPSLLAVQNNLVNLEHFNDEIGGLNFIKMMENKMAIRRPYPLFYYFKLFFEKNRNIDRFFETVLFKRLTIMNKEEYINDLTMSYRHVLNK